MKNTGKKTENWIIARNTQCALCGSDKVQTRHKTKFFTYGTLENQTKLQAEVPVYRCTECNFTYTDQEGDQLCHDAVCKFLQVLTPTEIRTLRKKTGLTIKEFSKFTGIGQASISRWENSRLIQDKAMDFYLRLLGVFENLQAIRGRIDNAIKSGINTTDKNPHIEPVPTAHANYRMCNFLQTDQKTVVQKNKTSVGGHEIMTPEEVRRIRLNLNQTTREFSKNTGIGAASLCRWEQGSLIQNRAMDNYLFLLSLPGNFKFLMNIGKIFSDKSEKKAIIA